MKEWVFRWGPAILIMGLIFFASSTAESDIPDFGRLDFFAMKGGHLVGYALLGGAFLHGISRGSSINVSKIITAMILVIIYAASDEWHQSFTPGRNPSLSDILIDTAGGFLGIAILKWIRKILLYQDRKESS